MKFKDLPKFHKNGKTPLTVENARIKSVSIGNEDHGCLTAWLHLEFGNGGCGFGGFKLGSQEGGNLEHRGWCAEFINRCIKIGVGEYGKWEDLEGQAIRVLNEGWGGGVVAVGHLLDDEWFCPRLEWANEK